MGRLLVKICGNRFVADARMVAALGPDLMGWIFSPVSARRVFPLEIRPLLSGLKRDFPAIRHVGVFALNSVPDMIQTVAALPELDFLQVVGGSGLIGSLRRALEDAELQPEFRPRIIPALRVRARVDSVELGRFGPAALYLLDAYVPGQHGGTGQKVEPSFVRGVRRPYLLAGGLNPDNVLEILRATGAPGVDVASGLEFAGQPARKDPEKVRRFMEICRNYNAD